MGAGDLRKIGASASGAAISFCVAPSSLTAAPGKPTSRMSARVCAAGSRYAYFSASCGRAILSQQHQEEERQNNTRETNQQLQRKKATNLQRFVELCCDRRWVAPPRCCDPAAHPPRLNVRGDLAVAAAAGRVPLRQGLRECRRLIQSPEPLADLSTLRSIAVAVRLQSQSRFSRQICSCTPLSTRLQQRARACNPGGELSAGCRGVLASADGVVNRRDARHDLLC